MEKAMDGMKTDMEQLRKRWEQVQARLVAEVEHTNAENARLNQAMSDQNAELDRPRRERDAAERRHRQSQAELGLAQLELTVAKDDVQKARASRDATIKENDRLRSQLEKRTFSAQANLKRIIERFREQTKVAIQMATATTLQSWAEQAAELQCGERHTEPGYVGLKCRRRKAKTCVGFRMEFLERSSPVDTPCPPIRS
jgi:chromosome segregation ATPase